MFEAIKNEAKTTAINAILGSDRFMDFVNKKTQRYADVRSVRKTDRGFEVVAQLRGSTEIMEVVLKDISIREDCSAIVLTGFSSNVEWLNHVLEDFAEGKSIDIPGEYHSIVSMVRKVL